MTCRNRRFRFAVVMFFALGMVRTGMASVAASNIEQRAVVEFKFINYVSFLVESLSIPVSTCTMNAYERTKLSDLYERKKEIIDSLGFYVSGREFYVEKRNLPLVGAFGAMLETAASVRHLWSSNLQWLRFKSNCKSGQALAARLRVMKSPS